MDKKDAPVVGKDKLGREVRDLSVIKWWGVDRKEIEWYPKINYERCARCGLCFIGCGRRVFDWDDKEDKPIVARPYNCMVGCQTCANLCPCGAIEFPDVSYAKRWVAEAEVLRKAFEIMEPIRPKLKKPSDDETRLV